MIFNKELLNPKPKCLKCEKILDKHEFVYCDKCYRKEINGIDE